MKAPSPIRPLKVAAALARAHVVAALHEVGIDRADLDVAVVQAFDAQQVPLGQFVGFDDRLDRGVVDGGGQRDGGLLGIGQRVEVEQHAGHDGGQRGAVDERGSGAAMMALARLYLAHQFGQRIAADRLGAFAGIQRCAVECDLIM